MARVIDEKTIQARIIFVKTFKFTFIWLKVLNRGYRSHESGFSWKSCFYIVYIGGSHPRFILKSIPILWQAFLKGLFVPRQKNEEAFGIGIVFSFKFKSDRRFGRGPLGTSGSLSSSPSGKWSESLSDADVTSIRTCWFSAISSSIDSTSSTCCFTSTTFSTTVFFLEIKGIYLLQNEGARDAIERWR